jgi:histidyl-tRNA synthetase
MSEKEKAAKQAGDTPKKQQLIQPRTLKGFRDFPPALAMPREEMIDRAKDVFRSYGFAPIDTPALEYAEILTGKGGDESDKQMYRFTDHGGRDVALRFDLTVPFARFAAQHAQQLGLPFKRYHVGPVWRGENTQHGRYREFYQCDFDTIGTDSNAADIETALVIHDILAALGFERFQIHVNNRKVLSGLLLSLGLEEQTTAVLRALDKLAKIGDENVAAEMQQAGVSAAKAQTILDMVQVEGSNGAILAQLWEQLGHNELAAQGVKDLMQLTEVFAAAEIPASRLAIDVSIARGLDYYTGTVFETLLDDLPGIGSICSGGRYDNLAALYTKQHLPGVGASLGLDRLLAAMEELGLLREVNTPAKIFIVQFTADALSQYIQLSRRLRAAGIATEVSTDAKGMGKQLKYADRKGFRFAVIGGPDELAKGVWQIKDLRGDASAEVSDEQIVDYLSSN